MDRSLANHMRKYLKFLTAIVITYNASNQAETNEALRIWRRKKRSRQEMDRHTAGQHEQASEGKRMNWMLTVRRFIMNFFFGVRGGFCTLSIQRTNLFTEWIFRAAAAVSAALWVDYDAKMKRAICNFSSAIAITPFLVGFHEWALFAKAIVVCERANHTTIIGSHTTKFYTAKQENRKSK